MIYSSMFSYSESSDKKTMRGEGGETEGLMLLFLEFGVH